MATNKSSRDAMVVVAVVIAFSVTVMANLLADRKFTRVDLTSEGRYSLSKEFSSILSRLENTADITYYVSKQVPGEFENAKRDILDKLNEIVLASRGKIKLLVVDPKDNQELREELSKVEGTVEVSVARKDEQSRSLLTSSLKINYEDKPKVLTPFIGSAEQLEYLLGSKFSELTLKKKPIVAIDIPPAPPQQPMMGQQQQQQGSGFEWLQYSQFEDLKKFELKGVDLSEANSIPADATVFIIIRPKALSERQRYEVIKFLAGGGKVIMLTSPFKVSNEFGSWRNEKTPSGLEEYLKDVGVTFSPDLVCDRSSLQMPNVQSFFQGKPEYKNYPFFVRVLGENIDQESSLTRFMPGLLMPIPAAMILDESAAKKAGLVARVLAKTSKQSWHVPFSESINPDRAFSGDDSSQRYEGSMNVVMTLEGQFPFPYEGKPVPEWKKEDGPPGEAEKKKGEPASIVKKPGTLMLCSCPEAFHLMYLNDQVVGNQMKSNIFLMINMLETFGLGNDDLVKLRTKRYETRSLDKLTGAENDFKRDFIKYFLFLGIPILIVCFAVVRALIRRAAQNKYERKFAQTIGPSSFTPS